MADSTGSAGATFNCVGGSASTICLQNCNLGCSETGCSRTDIAQNEIIILQFSQAIDPVSVSSSSIRFRTASGEQPVGEFFVNGNQVEFVPTLQVSGGQTFFGFTAGETYTMTLPGAGEPAVVRSTSGKPFAKTLSCTLRSSQGIVDLNGVPPRATLITPTQAQLGSAPRDIDIVLEFNELIDATPFQGGVGPVTFQVRRTRETPDPSDGDARECDSASPPAVLGGTTRLDFDAARLVSVLTFRPAAPMPGNVCIEIAVTNGVADLSGRSAQPQQFSFLTEQVPLSDFAITEEFDNTDFFDEEASAATWGGGQATFARIGGDARHGTFSVSLGQDLGTISGKRTYLFNTDNTIIPAANTTSGSAVSVSDGLFYFDKMVVPGDVRLRFTGTSPPVFTVAGRLDIQGEIDIVGQPVALALASATAGQPGSAGGIFAGAGGKGGDRNPGTGIPPLVAYNGSNGQPARVRGNHSWAPTAAATPGKGSDMFPASGLSTALVYPPLPFVLAYSVSAAAGGSGGGLFQPGEDGRVLTNNFPNGTGQLPPLVAAMGPLAAGGSAIQLDFPPLQRSSLHYLLGGAGGGGAGSHACFAASTNKVWVIGGGGGGGGGAIALRAGDSLRVGPLGKVLASGGSTPNSSGAVSSAQPAPGGGGSGGSVVLQSGRLVEIAGTVDVRGGTGGTFNRFATNISASAPNPPVSPAQTQVQIKGGNGSPGLVRLEAPGTPTTTLLATMLPAAVPQNVGPLVELDDFVSFRSDFYSTQLVFGPEYSRYEIYATIDGVPMVFSDDPTVSTVPALVGAPLQALFQAATLDLSNGQVLALGPWRRAVRTSLAQTGIQSDGLNGYRFSLILDGSLATTASIQKIVVVYRN